MNPITLYQIDESTTDERDERFLVRLLMVVPNRFELFAAVRAFDFIDC